MTEDGGLPARVLTVSRQLHYDRRFTVAVWIVFLLGVALMYDALFHDIVPFGGSIGWLLSAGAAVVYVQVEFQAALGTLRLHPEYESIWISKKIEIWSHLMNIEHWFLAIVAFGLTWVGLVGFVFVHPYVFIAVTGYGGLFTVLGSSRYYLMSKEEFEAEMGSALQNANLEGD